MKKSELNLLRESIREFTTEIIAERRRARKKKPGGGLTDSGAKRHLDPEGWRADVKNALLRNGGDVHKTADSLGIAVRTLYKFMEDEPILQRAKDKAEGEDL